MTPTTLIFCLVSRTLRSLLVLLSFLMLPMEGVGDELVMGYRTNERLPFIDDETNNGIYLDLFGEACRKIGVALKVVRLPKVRVAHALQQGTVDFYPGYSFTVERASHITFFPN